MLEAPPTRFGASFWLLLAAFVYALFTALDPHL